jgi:hypothetical protein
MKYKLGIYFSLVPTLPVALHSFSLKNLQITGPLILRLYKNYCSSI